MPKNKNIQLLSVSVRGALHKANALPCQDFSCYRQYKNKAVGIVSDGAGSAKYAQIGAKIICETLCDLLIKANLKNVRQTVVDAINVARQKLTLHRFNKSKSTDDLINFSATMVGFFYHNGRGMFFHIGDGAGIAFGVGSYDNLIISEPENGAFSCETYFYTMDDWQDCLRFVPFEDVDRLLLMTDGVTGFVFSDDFYKIHRKFLIPIVEYLENEPRRTYAVKALRNTLNDSRAQRLNSDDKTILWAKLQ